MLCEVSHIVSFLGAALLASHSRVHAHITEICPGGCAKVCDLLLQRGASHSVISNCGTSPLMLAANLGYNDCVRVLCSHGADPNYVNILNLQYETVPSFRQSVSRGG